MERALDGTTLPVLSSEAMRAADRATIEDFGIPSFTLMERAALGVFGYLAERFDPLDTCSVLVLAGSGGNGGDGLAVARMLAQAGAHVFVVTTATPDGRGDVARNLELLERLEDDPACALEIERIDDSTDLAPIEERMRALAPFDVCIDALLGIGGGGALREPIATLCHWTLGHDEVIALDVPTGVDADTGAVVDEAAVAADVTLTMAAAKPGLLLGEGRVHSGEVRSIDIGIPPFLMEEAVHAAGSALIATDATVVDRLPARPDDAHKFSAGQVLAIAGSDAYTGAAALCCAAAARVGAGYVACSTTSRVAMILDGTLAEVAFRIDERDASGAAELLEAFERARAVVIGPGVGGGVGPFVRALLLGAGGASVVIDADGLNALADDAGREALRAAAERLAGEGLGLVLTPHPGEFARLAGHGVDGDPLGAARALSQDLGAVVVLKGAPTVIASPDGAPPFIARDVEPALATAGTGDVLAGMIGGFLAQGAAPLDAAVLGVHVGLGAAEFATETRAARSVVATDVIEALPQVLRERFDVD